MASKRMDVVRIAQQYVGCKRGSAKHKDLVDTFNSVKPHGEVGNYTCAWCAITWTAIQIKAGNDQSVAPYSYNCGTLITYAKKINAWVENDAFVPSPGDGIIYYWGDTGKGDCGVDNGVGCASHVGIVETVSGGYITVIEGNKGTTSACGRRRIQVNSRYIRGFITPHYADGTTEYDYTLVEDGDWGFATTLTTQHILGCTEDGEMGPNTIKAIQNKVGATADGEWGPNTTKAMQKFLSVTVDGEMGPITTKAWQHWCNEQLNPSGKKYTGELPSLSIKKSNTQVIADAIAWAKWIAGDNDFHYGYTSKDKKIDAHHNGCYFCGTQKTSGSRSKKGIVMYEHSYCCNPFVHAAWAHGGCIPQAIAICKKGSSWGFAKGEGYDTSKLFTKLGHPVKSKLEPGDVLCRDSHVALYIGNGQIAEAGGGDDNVIHSAKWNNSIRIKSLTDANYKKFTRVYRYNSSVDTTLVINHGEVSDRVKLWQAFLNWFNDDSVVSVDRYFGDETLKYTKEFQMAVGLTADGIIGANTLNKASVYCKSNSTKYDGEFPNLNSGVISANSQAISATTAFARQMVAQNVYYKKWTSDTKTHQCYVCHPNSGKGVNCIGVPSMAFKHGGGASVNCSMSGMSNNAWGTKLYAQNTDAKRLAFWQAKNGPDWAIVKTPCEGCAGMCFQKGVYKHMFYCSSSTTIIDSTSGQKGVKERNLSALKSYTKIYFKYTGNGKFSDITRNYICNGDIGTEVKKLQDFLLWAGYDLGQYGADSQFGATTEAAVKLFQKNNTLTVDGLWGEACNKKAKEITK